MPQIMCPNCGKTISLESRKATDFDLIKSATNKNPRTFTELLHITKLSRKTLTLRLKELCQQGILIKQDGAYRLNGAFYMDNDCKKMRRSFSNFLQDKKIRTSLILAIFLVSSSASGYVFATFFSPPHYDQLAEPKIEGSFSMALYSMDVEDLWAWQVIVTFDSSKLKVLKASPGNFSEMDYPLFLTASDIQPGVLLIGQCLSLEGDMPGKNGNYKLATIVFGYFEDLYELPKWTAQRAGFETWLKNSKGEFIPLIDKIELILEEPS
jgi:hypothetical protein